MRFLVCAVLAGTASGCFVSMGEPVSQSRRPPADVIEVPDAVRSRSHTDDVLFRDVQTAVERADRTIHRVAPERLLVDVTVVRPYDGSAAGEERWYVRHGVETALYVVRLEPAPGGGTSITVWWSTRAWSGTPGLPPPTPSP